MRNVLTRSDAIKFLQATDCACGRYKGYYNTLCRWCKYELPELLARDLCLGMNEGKVEAIENALDYLELTITKPEAVS